MTKIAKVSFLDSELPVERAFGYPAFRRRKSILPIGIGFPPVRVSLNLTVFRDVLSPRPVHLNPFGPITPLYPIGLIERNTVQEHIVVDFRGIDNLFWRPFLVCNLVLTDEK